MIMDNAKKKEIEILLKKELPKQYPEISIIHFEMLKCYTNKCYIASLNTALMFLEMFIREMCIYEETFLKEKEEYLKNPIKFNPDIRFEIFEKYEKLYEDVGDNSVKKIKRGFSFYELLKKSEGYELINSEEHQKLSKIYQKLRIPIQHGIFRRLIEQFSINQEIPVTRMNIKNGQIKQIKLKSTNKLLRFFSIEKFCEEQSYYTILEIDKFCRDKLEKNFKLFTPPNY